MPEDAGRVPYFYKVTVSQIDLYKVRNVEAENAANAKRDAIREEDRMRADNFRNLTELMFNLRKEFVTELTSKECRDHLPDIVRYSTRVGEQYGMDFDMLGEVLGVELTEAAVEESDKSWQEILEIEAAYVTMPEKVLLAVAFCAADDSATGYWRETWDSSQQRYVFEHKENSELDETYKMLEALGYEMSDDEKALQNGTHRIFRNYGLKEDAEDV